jgi:hypothetical protein
VQQRSSRGSRQRTTERLIGEAGNWSEFWDRRRVQGCCRQGAAFERPAINGDDLTVANSNSFVFGPDKRPSTYERLRLTVEIGRTGMRGSFRVLVESQCVPADQGSMRKD